MPSRRRNCAIDFFAFLVIGFWPVIAWRSPVAASSALLFEIASPMPMLTTIFSSFGACMMFAYFNSLTSAGRISSR